MMIIGKGKSYAAAGVDVEAGYESVRRIRSHVESTFVKGVVGSIGGFGGMFQPDLSGYDAPVFVTGTDGVGTKLKLAFIMDRHDTIGIDCVAMCVNDIVCGGAKPLFFLDYIATGKNYPEKIEKIVSGVAEGCRQAGCALIGGETAEMPGFYDKNEYDIAGFSVGIVDKKKIIDGSTVQDGDALIGISSSGVHSNGFSLVRKVFGVNEKSLRKKVKELETTLGDELLKPTRIYVSSALRLIEKVNVKAICHITGGGFIENVPRMLPEGIEAVIDPHSFPTPPIFELLQREGNISPRDMFNTFNMGIGMIFAVSRADTGVAIASLIESGERPYIIGSCRKGGEGAVIQW